jgi:hypothetical protein
VDKLERERAELIEAFNAQPGWRVTVQTARGKPLAMDAFDPINVTRLSKREILHKRWLKLHNNAGSLEILNHGSVTVGAGAHPLFDGVQRWTTAGLPDRPDVRQEGTSVSVTSPMLKITFSNAEVESWAESVIIRLR